MRFHAECAGCLIDGQMKLTEHIHDEELRNRVVKEMCRVIIDLDTELDAAPIAHGEFIRLRREILGVTDDYSGIKSRYNELAMSLLPALRRQVQQSADPLFTALKLSMAGNYVDFGVVKDVSEQNMLRFVAEAADKPVDKAELENLRRDLGSGGEVIFLHDNCGEIAFDRLLIETILGLYPGIKVCSVVRGGPVTNYVTMEDARETGLADMVEVITNGMKDMGGTPLHMVPAELKNRLENAGTIIAKGMGNFETMQGTGLNTYYLLLAKCAYYERWFGLKQFEPVFVNDRRMPFGRM